MSMPSTIAIITLPHRLYQPTFMSFDGSSSVPSSRTGVMGGASSTGIEPKRWGASAFKMILYGQSF
jgi:hypothetical protein